MKKLDDKGSPTISEAHFFAAAMQFGVKPAVYNPKVR